VSLFLGKRFIPNTVLHVHNHAFPPAAWAAVQAGMPNDLIARLQADENITRLVPAEEIAALARVDGYVGNAPRRARELAETIRASLLVADPS